MTGPTFKRVGAEIRDQLACPLRVVAISCNLANCQLKLGKIGKSAGRAVGDKSLSCLKRVSQIELQAFKRKSYVRRLPLDSTLFCPPSIFCVDVYACASVCVYASDYWLIARDWHQLDDFCWQSGLVKRRVIRYYWPLATFLDIREGKRCWFIHKAV